MGYIGNEPTTGHFPVDNFTSSGGSTYTLAKAPATAGAIEVSVQGVLQPTTAYTVSGTTLTMAGVTTGVKIFVRHLGETLSLPTPADGSVTTAKLGVNSVDGTKIAMGSDAQGDILYHGATDYARLAKGTATQVLTMNAGATAPEWAAAGGGSWEYISTATASASASLAFTNMVDTYDYHYAFDAILPTNDSNDMTAQLGVAGPTYRTSGYKSTVCGINNSGLSQSGELTTAIFMNNGATNVGLGNVDAGSEGLRTGYLQLTNPAYASTKTSSYGMSVNGSTAAAIINNYIGSVYGTAEAHTSIKFILSTGTIASGKILQYRRVRS